MVAPLTRFSKVKGYLPATRNFCSVSKPHKHSLLTTTETKEQ